jgi:polysaccharide pyruvyl transferase WcaK-like protein
MRILLIGYYGKANFGDDVLLKVTHGRIRTWQPDAEITILCDQYQDDYIPSLLGEKVRIIQPGAREHFDLIVHGGGGTFFDFSHYGPIDRIIDKTIRIAEFNYYAALDRSLRALFGKQSLTATTRFGLGIGVGTYSAGSKKLRQNILTLLDFDTLIVRDRSSVKNLGALGLSSRATLGSDLAFLGKYWVPNKGRTINSSNETMPRLGLILRDWLIGPYKDYLRTIAEMLPVLSQQYKLSLFVFDNRVDDQLLTISKPYTTHVWTPSTSRFDDYCALLAMQDVIVSSRAHGAMCGAILGVPSLLVEIEPKLRSIHEMLPYATCLLRPDELVLPRLISEIEVSLKCEPNTISADVERNQTIINNAVDATLEAYGES